jgi:excisionase family DNA binding protein
MRTATRKDVLTTGEVARLCHVAPRTVSKWFDTGKLRGYRIPGSRDRRIPRNHLLAFMRAHGLPMEALDGALCRVLLVGVELKPAVIDPLLACGRYDIQSAANGFEAGMLAADLRPHVILMDARRPQEAANICRNIKSRPELLATRVLALDAPQGTADSLGCFDAMLKSPLSAAELSRAIETSTNFLL